MQAQTDQVTGFGPMENARVAWSYRIMSMVIWDTRQAPMPAAARRSASALEYASNTMFIFPVKTLSNAWVITWPGSILINGMLPHLSGSIMSHLPSYRCSLRTMPAPAQTMISSSYTSI